eukprot:GHVU01007365.1.p2 GENE.GHVU01007365.1~~GHVU01007365.1.p2  ORF type:complete len:136 (+),score=16.83 GHVU01007365.1:624-1031(+)
MTAVPTKPCTVRRLALLLLLPWAAAAASAAGGQRPAAFAKSRLGVERPAVSSSSTRSDASGSRPPLQLPPVLLRRGLRATPCSRGTLLLLRATTPSLEDDDSDLFIGRTPFSEEKGEYQRVTQAPDMTFSLRKQK